MAEDSNHNLPFRAHKRGKRATAHSRNEAEEDRLSALPDSLLLRILSSLRNTKQVISTCVLSKRWRFLWTESSEFVVYDSSRDYAKIWRFVHWVGRILVMCSGTRVKKLYFQFSYQCCFASYVDHWVYFVVKNKVKDLTLFFLSSNGFYELPQILFSSSSLTNLTVSSCLVAPRGSVEWGSLKELWISDVGLVDYEFEKVLLGCPVLWRLMLTSCWGFDHLKIDSRYLAQLWIGGWRQSDNGRSLKITAPYLHVLSVSDKAVTRFFVVGNFSSLVMAIADYKFAKDAVTFAQVDSRLLRNVKRSLDSFSSVKDLVLGPWCIEVLSRLEEKGLHLSPSTRLRLSLTAWRCKRSIAGILNILKNSQKLETLVINGKSFEPHLMSHSDNQATCYLQDDSSDFVLRNLKIIKINAFSEPGLSGEPMLTLVQLLLKSATNLVEMVIDSKTGTGNSFTPSGLFDLLQVSQKLLSLPRSSPKAVVLVHPLEASC